MDTSDIIASLAFFISILSLLVAWLAYNRDKSHLKLTIEFQVNSISHGKYLINISNDGRRPSTLSKVAARIRFGKRHFFYEQEVTLAEGKTKLILAPLQLFPVRHPLEITSFEVIDTTGKKYRAFTILLIWQILHDWK